MLHIDKQLKQIAKIMNPRNCSHSNLFFRGYHDFDEYGNEHYNIGSNFERLVTHSDMLVVHIREYAKFIDDDYCPAELNKYLCAFLPLTHCPLPRHYLDCPSFDAACTPSGSGLRYDGAHADALPSASASRHRSAPVTVDHFAAVGDEYRSHAALDFSHISKSKYNIGIGSLFYVALFLRRNYDFRSRAASIVSSFRDSISPPFTPTTPCVGIHIRHHDRVKPGYDMIRYCNEFVRRPDGSCYNRSTNEPIEPDCRHHLDAAYGCGSAVPFGGISLEAYLKAASMFVGPLQPGERKSVFIVTDDGEWVEAEKSAFEDEWNIFVLPAQPRHRSRATVNGAVLFASVELIQQCSALVGHTVSAFTVLLRAIMCIRHGTSDAMKFGQCPKFYNFRDLS